MSRLLHSLPRAAGGRKMDSIVREVVSRSGVQPRLPESPTQSMGVGAEDAELERILASLRTNIKIVGIGGGGCNTSDRLGRRPGRRAAVEGGGRPLVRDLQVPLPGGGSDPSRERRVWPRETPQLRGHGRRDPE